MYDGITIEREVLISHRYLYRLYLLDDNYWVYCKDIIKERGLRHGPFTIKSGNEFLDVRVEREKSLER